MVRCGKAMQHARFNDSEEGGIELHAMERQMLPGKIRSTQGDQSLLSKNLRLGYGAIQGTIMRHALRQGLSFGV